MNTAEATIVVKPNGMAIWRTNIGIDLKSSRPSARTAPTPSSHARAEVAK